MSESARIVSWHEVNEDTVVQEISTLIDEGYHVATSGNYPPATSHNSGRAWVLLVKHTPAVLSVEAIEEAVEVEATGDVFINIHLPGAQEGLQYSLQTLLDNLRGQ